MVILDKKARRQLKRVISDPKGGDDPLKDEEENGGGGDRVGAERGGILPFFSCSFPPA